MINGPELIIIDAFIEVVLYVTGVYCGSRVLVGGKLKLIALIVTNSIDLDK